MTQGGRSEGSVVDPVMPAVVFLASPRARFITGAAFGIGGAKSEG
jgi:hypothetical protein